MSETTEVKIIDNSDKVLKEFKEQLEGALDAIGATAEKYAKRNCPVDTGRLRNSISHIRAGQKGGSYTYTAMEHYITKKGTKSSKRRKTEHKSEIGSTESDNSFSVYIGTNVEYAKSVEYNDKAKHKRGKAHFLRDAASKHGTQYRKIVKAALEGSSSNDNSAETSSSE